MAQGGYTLIDLFNKSLSSTAVVISKIYKYLSLNRNKAVMLTHVVIEDERYDDVFVEPIEESNGDFTIIVYNKKITIKENNEVTAVNAPSPSATATWGSITGTLSNQTDLSTALSGKIASGAISASASGTSTDEVSYITIEGTEYKIATPAAAAISVYVATGAIPTSTPTTFTLSDSKTFDDIAADIQANKFPVLVIKRTEPEPGEHEYYCLPLEYYYYLPDATDPEWNELSFTCTDADSFNLLRATLLRDQSTTTGSFVRSSIQPALSAGTGISINNNTVSVNNTIATQTDLQQGLATRQALLSDAQIAATNSGITSTKVGTYDGYASTIAGKSTVSVSDTGTATDEISYITVDGVEKKIAGGGGGGSYTFTNGLTESGGTVSWDLNSDINFVNTNSYIDFTGAPSTLWGQNNTVIGRDNTVLASSSTYSGSSYNMLVGRENKIDTTYYGTDTNLYSIGYANRFKRTSHNGTTQDSYQIGDSNTIQNGGSSTFRNIYSIGKENTVSSGNATEYKFLFGTGLQAYGDTSACVILGKHNVKESGKILIVGSGSGEYSRSNALTVTTDGILQCTNIPAAPTSDGNYVLKCSIVSGVATYTWEAQS